MHMANELLSIPVAGGTVTIAAAAIAVICRKARDIINSEKLALMGIMGAFVFAAQMVNFQLPAMPGTSGHMIGAVLLAIILGPAAAAIVMSSVIIIQCLIFQDGGLLALGCNIINMGIIPVYVGYYLYKIATKGSFSNLRTYIAVFLACIIGIEAGAVLVPIQAALSGVIVVPFTTFLITMLGVHLLVSIVEGMITLAVLAYLQQVRPDILQSNIRGNIRLSKKAVLTTMVVFTVIIAAGLSLFASSMPDGLEWSYLERPDQQDFKPIVANDDPRIQTVDEFQSKYAPLPDYSVRNSDGAEVSAGWTSFAGVFGAFLTMIFVWLIAKIIRKKAQKTTPVQTL